MIKCEYINEYDGKNKIKCKTCKNNIRRNYVEDFFEKENDKVIPQQFPKLTYDGPEEQTAGYKFPVCENYTNPYQLVDGNCCRHCGYRLNI